MKAADESYNKRNPLLRDCQTKFTASNQFAKYANTLFQYLYYLQLRTPTKLQNIDISDLPKDYFILIDSLAKNKFSCEGCL